MELLTVRAGGTIHGVPFDEVLEIIDAWSITPLPLLPAGFAGVADVHGDAVPVADLTRLVGAELRSPRRTMIVVRGPETSPIALLVDTVETMASVPDVEPLPDRPPWIAGVAAGVVVIDARKLVEEVVPGADVSLARLHTE